MAVTFSSIDTREQIEQKRIVSAWIKSTIAEENKQVWEVAIALCSDEYILQANRDYLKHDYFTDIITFDYSSEDLLSGDLLISVDTVKSNAEEYGVTFREELMRVVIHGVLHLCGYKDKAPDEQKLMRQKEDYYLRQLKEKLKIAKTKK